MYIQKCSEEGATVVRASHQVAGEIPVLFLFLCSNIVMILHSAHFCLGVPCTRGPLSDHFMGARETSVVWDQFLVRYSEMETRR